MIKTSPRVVFYYPVEIFLSKIHKDHTASILRIEDKCLFLLRMERRLSVVVRTVMLFAGLCLLLSVVVPHHHHENGLPCLLPLTEQHHAEDDPAHDCGCEGHHMAFNQLLLSDAESDTHYHLLFPQILFDCIHPVLPDPVFETAFVERISYIDSLYDTWIVSASGLRAPPCFV